MSVSVPGTILSSRPGKLGELIAMKDHFTQCNGAARRCVVGGLWHKGIHFVRLWLQRFIRMVLVFQ